MASNIGRAILLLFVRRTELHPKSWTKKEDFFTGVRSSSEGLRKKQPRLITKNRMDINMKWWQIQFPEEETSSTPLAISPDGKETLNEKVMKEHIEISFPSEISNLTSLEIDLQAVEVRFSEIVDKLAKELDIGGRSLVISVMTRASDRVGVAKRSFRWGDRYRLFISISIPSHKQTLWGLRKVEWSLWNPISDSRHFYFVEEIDYSSYNTIEDYIVDAATKALILLFTKGVTCGGHRIKFSKCPL